MRANCTTKCVKIQKDLDPTKVIELDVFECEHCDKELCSQITLNNHLQKCKALVKKNYVLEKELQPLQISDYRLIYRKKDGYIDVTNMCQAGGKKYNDWYRLDKTQGYLSMLSRSVGIPTDLLIQTITGGKMKIVKHGHIPGSQLISLDGSHLNSI